MKNDPRKRKTIAAQRSMLRSLLSDQHQAALACSEVALAEDRFSAALKQLQERGLIYCIEEVDSNGKTTERWFASEHGPLAGKYGPHSSKAKAPPMSCKEKILAYMRDAESFERGVTGSSELRTASLTTVKK
jgi:hypothetical protein